MDQRLRFDTETENEQETQPSSSVFRESVDEQQNASERVDFAEPTRRKSVWIPTFFKWTLSIGAVAAAVAGGVWKYTAPIREAANDLPAAVEAYKKAGMPWTAEELDPYAKLPDSENAATYLRASNELVHQLKIDQIVKEVPKLIADGNLSGAENLLAPFVPVVRYAKLAAEKNHLSFQRNWNLGPGVLLPEESYMIQTTRTLDLFAELEAAKGNGAASAEYLRTSLKIGALLKDEPVLIGALVGVRIRGSALTSAQRSAALLEKLPDELRKFIEGLPIEESGLTFAGAVRGEEFMAVAMGRIPGLLRFALPNPGPAPMPNIPRSYAGGVPGGMSDRATLDRMLRYWIECDDIVRASADNPIEIGGKLDQVAKDWQFHDAAADKLISQIAPVFNGASVEIAKNQALERATDALLKAYRFKADHGHFPSGLPEIGHWIDPFTGGPLKMIVAPHMIKIYSVGPDKVDNGGLTKSNSPDSDSDQGTDIAASNPPPPRTSRD